MSAAAAAAAAACCAQTAPSRRTILLPPTLAPAGARADIAQGEDTSVAELASHDGMLLFNGALRAAVPPNATDPRQSARCPCSDAAPRDTSSGKPPFLVSIDCFGQALYGNCNASFMQARVVGSRVAAAGRKPAWQLRWFHCRHLCLLAFPAATCQPKPLPPSSSTPCSPISRSLSSQTVSA